MQEHAKMNLCVCISFPGSKVEPYNTVMYPRSSPVSVGVVIIRTVGLINTAVEILTKKCLLNDLNLYKILKGGLYLCDIIQSGVFHQPGWGQGVWDSILLPSLTSFVQESVFQSFLTDVWDLCKENVTSEGCTAMWSSSERSQWERWASGNHSSRHTDKKLKNKNEKKHK